MRYRTVLILVCLLHSRFMKATPLEPKATPLELKATVLPLTTGVSSNTSQLQSSKATTVQETIHKPIIPTTVTRLQTTSTTTTAAPLKQTTASSKLQERLEALSCELPTLAGESRLWKGNETHELLFPITVSSCLLLLEGYPIRFRRLTYYAGGIPPRFVKPTYNP